MQMSYLQEPSRYDDFLEIWKNLDYVSNNESKLNQYEQQSQLMGDYAELNGHVISIFDVKKNKILYISDNYPSILGYTCSKETFSKWNTFFLLRDLPFSQSIFVMQMSQLFKKTVKPFLQNKELKKIDWIIYNFMRKPPGSERKHTCHICKALEIDSNGNIEVILAISKDLKPIIKDQDVWWFQINVNEELVCHFHSNEKKFVNKWLLSEREREIVKLIEQGYDSKQISEKLFISPKTVDTHRKNILERVAVKDFHALFNLVKGSKLL
jgi:DNA-binding CsgD family transcriptional regulator